MKKFFIALLFVMSIVLPFAPITVKAAESTSLSFTIHLYSYSKEYKSMVEEGMSDEEIQKVLSEDKQLTPVSGVVYHLTQIAPTDNTKGVNFKDKSTWKIKENGFSTTLTTDNYGVANVNEAGGLVKGYYLLTQEKSTKLLHQMEDKLVTIPATSDDGKSEIYDVHMYPKEEGISKLEPSTDSSSTTDSSTSTTTTESSTSITTDSSTSTSTTPSSSTSSSSSVAKVTTPSKGDSDPQTGVDVKVKTFGFLKYIGLLFLAIAGGFIYVYKKRNANETK